MAYQSNGNYKMLTDSVVKEILSILAEVDPDIMDDIANEMVDKLAVVISREIDAAYERGEKAEAESWL